MALSINFCGSVASTTGATSYTCDTGLATPPSNSLLIACVFNSLASSPLDPSSVTGHGETYSALTLSARTVSTTHTMSVWVAKSASPTSTAVSASFGSVSQTGCTILEFYVTGADLSGTAAAAIVQNPTTSGTGGDSQITATNLLAAAGNANNQALAFWGHLYNAATTPGGGNWSEPSGADVGYNTPRTQLEAQVATTFDRSPAATWANSVAYRVVGLEIKASSAVSVPLTGLQAVAAKQDISVASSHALAGVEATFAAGNVTASWGKSVPLVGVEMTLAAQVLSAAHSATLTGLESVAERGDVVAGGMSRGYISWAVLQIPEQVSSVDLVGVQMDLAMNVPSPASSVGLASAEAIAALGDVGAPHEVQIVGLEATIDAGTLTAQTENEYSVDLVGLQVDLTISSLTPMSEIAVSGAAVTVEQESLAVGIAPALTGLGAEIAQENLGAPHEIVLAGLEAWFSIGTLTPEKAGEYYVDLEGLPLVATAGSLTATGVIAISGAPAVATQGDLTVTFARSLASAEVVLAQGVLGKLHVVPLASAEAVIARGDVGLLHAVSPASAEAIVAQGAVGTSRVVALVGLDLTLAAGTVTPQKSGEYYVDLVGLELSFAPGSLSVANSITVPGLQAIATLGAITPSRAHALMSAAAVIAAGDIKVARARALLGLDVSASVGTLTPHKTGGDTVVSLTGLEITIAAGTLTARGPTATEYFNQPPIRIRVPEYIRQLQRQDEEVAVWMLVEAVTAGLLDRPYGD